MNGIETPQHTPIQRRRRIEQLLIKLDHIEPTEQSARPGHCSGTVGTDRAYDFDPSQRARSSLRFAAQFAFKRCRLGFPHDELDQRR
jgi:hypothetical protein